jgi:hypothetical protein
VRMSYATSEAVIEEGINRTARVLMSVVSRQ